MSRGEIVLYVACSLDGYVATEDGGVSWLDEFDDRYEDGVAGGSYEEFFADVDCLVMGSRTYEQVVSFGAWPYEDRPTYVTTHRDLPRASDRVEFFEGDPADLAERVTAAFETTWLVGGAALARAFLRADLVETIRLSVVPLLLGDGIPLFGDHGGERALHLRDATAYETGIVELQYAVGDRPQG